MKHFMRPCAEKAMRGRYESPGGCFGLSNGMALRHIHDDWRGELHATWARGLEHADDQVNKLRAAKNVLLAAYKPLVRHFHGHLRPRDRARLPRRRRASAGLRRAFRAD